jgi:hypothetical protein
MIMSRLVPHWLRSDLSNPVLMPVILFSTFSVLLILKFRCCSIRSSFADIFMICASISFLCRFLLSHNTSSCGSCSIGTSSVIKVSLWSF